MTAAVVLRRLAETLERHAETVEHARRATREGHYSTRVEQALADVADVLDEAKP